MKMLKIESIQGAQNQRSSHGLVLTPGTKLAALVLEGARPGGKALLSIAGGQLLVTTQQTLNSGQALNLIVTKLGQQVHLQIHDPERIERQQLQINQTRALLNMLSQLNLSAPQTSTSTAGSQNFAVLPEGLTSLLARPEGLIRPGQLRQYLTAMIPATTNLGQTKASLNGSTNLGSVLLRAAQLIRNTNTESRPEALKSQSKSWEQAGSYVLRSLISTALAQNTPAQNAQQTQGREPQWIMALPINVDGSLSQIELAIRGQPDEDSDEGEQTWRIDLAFDLFDLGPIHAALRLTGDQLSLDLFAEHSQTQARLNQHQAQLEAGLTRAGLSLAQFAVYPGPAPQSIRDRLQPQPQQVMGLLREQA
ncbi:MAG TPA: flagellar hook-length control protein FliK [Halothiobacillaceae bacterium]|nr:flagellar hook-length control protein FliK [Halothiobacillaceae bacterium]